MKKVVFKIIFILIFTSFHAHSQNCEVLNEYVDSVYSKEEIGNLEKLICELLKIHKAIPEDNKVNLYYIPKYDLSYYCIMPPDSISYYYLNGKEAYRIKKSDFLDGSFLKRLSRGEMKEHYKKIIRKKRWNRYIIRARKAPGTYIPAEVIVTNSSDSVIAFDDSNSLMLASQMAGHLSSKAFILEKMRELKLKQVFTLNGIFPLGHIFGVTEDNQVIVFSSVGIDEVYTTKEYLEKCFLKDERMKRRFYD